MTIALGAMFNYNKNSFLITLGLSGVLSPLAMGAFRHSGTG